MGGDDDDNRYGLYSILYIDLHLGGMNDCFGSGGMLEGGFCCFGFLNGERGEPGINICSAEGYFLFYYLDMKLFFLL